MTEHYLPAERLHFAWDNSLPPVLEVEPGDSVTIDTWDASGHEVKRTFTNADAGNRKRRALAGGRLVVEVLEVCT
jgi:acetamidase/formamidase